MGLGNFEDCYRPIYQYQRKDHYRKKRKCEKVICSNRYGESCHTGQQQIGNTEYVFDIKNQSTFRHRLEKYCIVNGLDYVSLYELMHTFVIVAKGFSDGELRQLVGHSKSMDTYGVYSHEVQDDQLRTAEKLNNIWGKVVAAK